MQVVKDNTVAFIKAIKSADFQNTLGLAVIRIITSRTRQGIGVEGESFGTYSDSYIKLRERNHLPTSPVIMTFDQATGMMSKITHVVANDLSSVSVFFDSPEKEQIARYWNIEGAGRNRMFRKFWGIFLKSEINELSRIGFNTLRDIIKKL